MPSGFVFDMYSVRYAIENSLKKLVLADFFFNQYNCETPLM
jgi:hypothetical protein